MRHLAVAALLLGSTALAADWDRFRGPNGTGVAAGKLPEIGPKTTLWKVPLPGKGVSSPIVVGGKIYVQSASDDGAKRFLVCLDAATGKSEWTKTLVGGDAKRHKLNSLASGTPACDGKMIYCLWWDGGAMSIAAYDLAGEEKWSHSLGSYTSDHGPGHSPTVIGGTVYVNFDGSAGAGGEAGTAKGVGSGAALVAFDAATGAKKWTAERKAYRASYSTPFLWERPGKAAEVVVGTTTEVTGYDPATGKVNWAYPVTWPKGKMPLRVVGSPLAVGNLVVCSFGDGGGARYAVGIDPAAKTPAKVWDLDKGTPYVPCMLTKADRLFWIGDSGVATCAEAKTGKVLWEERVATKDVTASPILMGDEILAVAQTGDYYVFKAAAEFELVRKGKFEEPVLASPAVADGKLYVRGASHLYCFGAR